MNDTPHINSIVGRLVFALSQMVALPGFKERFAGSLSNLKHGQISKDMAERELEWLIAVPSFHKLREWIVAHWDTERQTQPPAGTVSTGDKWGNQGEAQIDPTTAACKLLLAAALHGAEKVGKCAMEFSSHGMIEVRTFFLLKGMSVLNAKSLDDYCTLTPYRGMWEKVKATTTPWHTVEDLYWPPESAEDICVLETRSFERREVALNETERRVSRLLQCGSETLALILGLVWGSGCNIFGIWQDVSGPVAATLPFFYTTLGGGGGRQPISLAFPGVRPLSTSRRPLNEVELMDLTSKYADLSEQERRVLNLAMRRLRYSTERTELEDRVIDKCIALEALFMREGERWNQRKKVASRGSWHFADSVQERRATKAMLKGLFKCRNRIVHGGVLDNMQPEERQQSLERLLEGADNLVRASLKTMISDGIPHDWGDSRNQEKIRHDPPREATEIPSVKSDSLSWTFAEQKKIDQALEAVWRPTVDNAPEPTPDASTARFLEVNRAQIKQLERQGVYYIIVAPALLFMAHPKWQERANEPLDDHTRYYCVKDVDRHLQEWRDAVDAKKVCHFDLRREDATKYLPKHFDYWRKLLSGESVANPLNPQASNA